MTHYLDVVGESTAEVVVHAGGWIYDRVAAGWQVTVLVPEGCDARPLRILGADHEPLERVGCALVGPVRAHAALGVSAALHAVDPWAASIAVEAMNSGRSDVTLWGPGCASVTDPRMSLNRHRLSVAARAFKRQALAAARLHDAAPSMYEHLQTSIARRPTADPGLIYAG